MVTACPWDHEKTKPLANPFKIEPVNSYGRSMIDAQLRMHDSLIDNATAMTDCRIGKELKDIRAFRQQSQSWKLSFAEMHRRHMDDAVLLDLINNSRCQLDCNLDAHVLAFKSHRLKNPNFKPGWLEMQEQLKYSRRHQSIMAGEHIRSRVDNQPPWVALRYGQFLQSSRFTKGGAPRAVAKMPRRRRRAQPRAAVELPRIPTAEPSDTWLPMRRQQAMSVMGTADEPKMNYHVEYQYSEFPLESSAVHLPSITKAERPDDADDSYGEDFEDD